MGGSTGCLLDPGRPVDLCVEEPVAESGLLDDSGGTCSRDNGLGANGTDGFDKFLAEPDKSSSLSMVSWGKSRFSLSPSGEPALFSISLASEMLDRVSSSAPPVMLESGEPGGKASMLSLFVVGAE